MGKTLLNKKSIFFITAYLILNLSPVFARSNRETYITCNFNGQLGNQLWQIAATVGYALDHGYKPVFPNLLHAINGELNYRFILHRLDIFSLKNQKKMEPFNEFHSHRYCEIPDKGADIRLIGHFQSFKYFNRHENYIKELFAPTEEILNEIYQSYGNLLHQSPVAVHIRTYIPDNSFLEGGIGGGSWDYFITAMKYFPQDTLFLVFSDDIEWTKRNFPLKNMNIVFIQDNPHYIDFYLMSLCSHHIVSPESSFSWWAAWLNQNPNKIVIVADTWGGISDHDTIPPDWIQIPKKFPRDF